ncbi:hypothetical protein V6N13_092808 [Hibiscus sabdariffa]
MSEGSPVGAHVIKMMGYIQTLEKLGFPLKDELATDVILQSLPDSFKPFVLNFKMNEINKTLPQLLGMLRTAKSDLKKNGFKSILIVREAKRKGNKKESLRVLDTECGSVIQKPLKRRIMAKGNMDLRAGNGARVAALAIGTYISLIDLL